MSVSYIQGSKSLDLNKKNSIYAYTDYRRFLEDRVELLKSAGLYRVRAFARSVGFASPNYLKMVISGHRNLGSRFIMPMARTLNLSPVETQFFRSLVYFTDSKDMDLKDESFRKMTEFKGFREAFPFTLEQYQVFQDWRNIAILEGLSTNWAKAKLSELAQDLNLTVDEFKEKIALLASLNLIVRDPETGHWKRSSEAITTGDVVNDLNVRNFHREMIKRGLDSVDTLSLKERALGSLTLSLSEADYQRLNKMVDEFTLKITSEFTNVSAASGVYQLNFQFFPLLRQKKSQS